MLKTYSGALKGLYLLCLTSLFLPWFTYNASVMGYCWGWQFLPLFLVPMVLTGLYLFRFPEHRPLRILSQLSTFSNLAFLFAALGSWQEVCNIRGGFHPAEGFYTAQPGFWISSWLHLAFCILFHSSLFLSIRSKKEEIQ